MRSQYSDFLGSCRAGARYAGSMRPKSWYIHIVAHKSAGADSDIGPVPIHHDHRIMRDIKTVVAGANQLSLGGADVMVLYGVVSADIYSVLSPHEEGCDYKGTQAFVHAEYPVGGVDTWRMNVRAESEWKHTESGLITSFPSIVSMTAYRNKAAQASA